MQEIKHLILRVGTVANVEEYVFDGPMADAHIQGYLNQGFTLHTSHPGSVDQSTNSMSVFYVLIRETEDDRKRGTFAEQSVGMDVSKAQEQVNQMVAQEPSRGGNLKWEQEDAAVPA